MCCELKHLCPQRDIRPNTTLNISEEQTMKKIFLATLLLACCATLGLAQSLDEYPKNEAFVGYSYENADINSLTPDPGRQGLHGLNIAYTRYLNKTLGITVDFSGHTRRQTFTTSAGEFKKDRDQFNLMGGLQFKARNEKRLTPFAHALIGVGVFRGFSAVLLPSSNTYFFDDAKSLTMAFGGGLDLRVSKRVALRLVQADYNPTFFGRGHQNNFRLSFGVVFSR